MKKFVIFIVFLSIPLFKVYSQEISEVKIGLKAGINFSEVTGYEDYSSSPRRGFHIGPVISLKASELLTIEPALLYSQKGTVWERSFFAEHGENSLDSYSKRNMKLTYLDIPVLLKFNVFSGFSFFAGPQFSYLLSRVEDYKNNAVFDGEREYTEKGTNKDLVGYKRFDLALVGGIGYSFSSGISLAGSYDYGLKTVSANDLNIFNRAIKISVGYNF